MESGLLERTRRRSKQLRRRLINLIFADRARVEPAVMVMIRRELPRTTVAGPAMGLSHRINEDPPCRMPFDQRLLRSKCLRLISSRPNSSVSTEDPLSLRATGHDLDTQALLQVDPDGPDETRQLSRHGGHHLLFDLAAADQP